jgi:hypothetical protein
VDARSSLRCSALALLSFGRKAATIFMQHSDGRRTVMTVHAGETIGPGLLSKILRDTEMEGEELARWL